MHARDGTGIWRGRDPDPPHAVKHVDRLLSNQSVSVWLFSQPRGGLVVGSRREAIATFEWTDFAADGYSTIAAHFVTRATAG